MTNKTIRNIERYLSRLKHLNIALANPVDPSIQYAIVIPAYHETELLQTLDSLSRCSDSDEGVEVIVVLNSSDECSEDIRIFHRNQKMQIEASPYPFPVTPIILEKIPAKIAGVGFARKSGMDLALQRLAQHHAEDGVIICLDGDCLVSPNYIESIKSFFDQENAAQAIHLYFEHPFPTDESLRKSIIQYEMHLRLMKLQLQEAGHPQAFHAVGSCMALRASAYAAQGGMNSRQAGEDFYFIHKFSKIGQLAELNETTVYPSARMSNRVPFGTGAAVNKAMEGQQQTTYHPDSYNKIQKIISSLPQFYQGDYSNQLYFEGFKSDEFHPKISEIRKHTSSQMAFEQRFFQWFDAFQIIKFLHYLRDRGSLDLAVAEVSHIYLTNRSIPAPKIEEQQLILLRQLDRSITRG